MLHLLIQISPQNHDCNAFNVFFTVLSRNNARSENGHRTVREQSEYSMTVLSHGSARVSNAWTVFRKLCVCRRFPTTMMWHTSVNVTLSAIFFTTILRFSGFVSKILSLCPSNDEYSASFILFSKLLNSANSIAVSHSRDLLDLFNYHEFTENYFRARDFKILWVGSSNWRCYN